MQKVEVAAFEMDVAALTCGVTMMMRARALSNHHQHQDNSALFCSARTRVSFYLESRPQIDPALTTHAAKEFLYYIVRSSTSRGRGSRRNLISLTARLLALTAITNRLA